jgi:hypothetical protein
VTQQFAPNTVIIHGPGLPRVVKTVGSSRLVIWPGVASVIVRGRVPIWKDLRFPQSDPATGTKITGKKFLRRAAFEFCGGMADRIVEAAGTTDDLAVIGAAVQPLLNYMKGRFLIG